MLTQTSALPNLNSSTQRSKSKHQNQHTFQSTKLPNYNISGSKNFDSLPSNSNSLPEPQITNHSVPSPDRQELKEDHSQRSSTTHVLPADAPAVASSQLVIILAKLSELDDIKTHFYIIDNRLNSLQPQPLNQSLVAQCS